MNPEEYRKMRALEDRMWWYRGLHANLLALLHRHLPSEGPILDAGCGTGGFLRVLAEAMPGRPLFGIDREPLAAQEAAARGVAPIAIGSIDRLPFPDRRFAGVVSADVLYHRAVDEASALAEFRRCLAPGGVLVVNLPAYEWMRSGHDRAVHGARRYTAGRIRALLAESGFRPVFCGYWNAILFPLMAAKRKLAPDPGDGSDVMVYPAPVERTFGWAMTIENFVLRQGIGFPFGGSVLAAGLA
jgi:SAM-dependent methyltransferase